MALKKRISGYFFPYAIRQTAETEQSGKGLNLRQWAVTHAKQ